MQLPFVGGRLRCKLCQMRTTPDILERDMAIPFPIDLRKLQKQCALVAGYRGVLSMRFTVRRDRWFAAA